MLSLLIVVVVIVVVTVVVVVVVIRGRVLRLLDVCQPTSSNNIK
jgi:hypothetical protein